MHKNSATRAEPLSKTLGLEGILAGILSHFIRGQRAEWVVAKHF